MGIGNYGIQMDDANMFGSITFCMGLLIAIPRATKWLNLNNRGCLTHGCQNYKTSATKWLNFKKHYSAHIGAEDVCITFSVGFHRSTVLTPKPTVIEILPLSGQ